MGGGQGGMGMGGYGMNMFGQGGNVGGAGGQGGQNGGSPPRTESTVPMTAFWQHQLMRAEVCPVPLQVASLTSGVATVKLTAPSGPNGSHGFEDVQQAIRRHHLRSQYPTILFRLECANAVDQRLAQEEQSFPFYPFIL